MTLIRKGSRGYDVKIIQEYLTGCDYGTNGVDGIFGIGSDRAVRNFQKDFGLGVDGIVGNGTASKLLDIYWTDISDKAEDLPWMQEAFKDYFVSEIKGDKHESKVLAFWRDAKLGGIKDDETPYCSGAVSAWLERAGIRSQRTAWARNYLNQGVKLDEPKFGAIAVFERGNGGHVAFVTGVTEDGSQIRCLGANQSNSVNERMFDVNRVLGYRNPREDFNLPDAPVIDSGVTSKNEA
ncbi:putative endolysin [Vibrio phage VPMCC14]|nr:putative endolysin [Vibrio phage VPMCC14]